MKKILVIPADSIKNEISRSYFLAKYLAKNNEVYLLRWEDPQSLLFEKKKIAKIETLKCFISSLFQVYKLRPTKYNNLKHLYCSRMLFMVIYRFIGVTNALKLSRFYNSVILKKVAKRIQPDIVFYADGFDGQPLIEGNWINVSDIQDDFDESNFRDNRYQSNYGNKNFSKCHFNFVVSRNAKKKLEELYNAKFYYLPNGVEMEDMCVVDEKKLSVEKKLLKNKFVVSYIGGPAWVDDNFVKVLAEKSLELLPNIHYYIVGNLTNQKFPNVTFTGGVSKDEVKLYYHLSDVGIMLKSSEGSDFLKNSIPLKIFQYSIINKMFISPYISFLKEENFKNVRILTEYNPDTLINELKNVQHLRNMDLIDDKWNQYNWDNIVKEVENKIITLNTIE